MHRLTKTLRDIASVALAASAPVACSGASATTDAEKNPPTVRTSTDANNCSVAVVGYRPGVAVDYLAMRNERRAAGADAGTEIQDYEPLGTPCARATNVESCLQRLANLRTAPSSLQSGIVYLVYTRADEIGVVGDNRAELTRFLTPIDTPEEALKIAYDHGFSCFPSWEASPEGATRYSKDADGYVIRALRQDTDAVYAVTVRMAPDGTVVELERTRVRGLDHSVEGRRPMGLLSASGQRCESVGAYFAGAAHLEAASIVAFRRLERELRCVGAPAALLRRVRAACRDEIRHARETRRLARRFRAPVPRVRVERARPRALLDIAVENAVEGCVRETFGAAVALFRAGRTTDDSIAATMREIAEDECEHATLSWDIAAWLSSRLSEEEQAVVAGAFGQAVRELEAGVDGEPSPEVRRIAGAPTTAEEQLLLRGLTERVFGRLD